MVDLRWRAVVFAVVTTVVLTTWYLWDISPHPGMNIYPPPSFLGSTSYGPIMLLLIPAALGWLSLAPKRRYVRVINLLLTMLVFALCVLVIIASIQAVRPWLLPWWPPEKGWIGMILQSSDQFRSLEGYRNFIAVTTVNNDGSC